MKAMKKLFNIIFTGLLLMAGLASCTDNNKTIVTGDSVDLRYRIENKKDTLAAISPKAFTIVVKSTKPWTITSDHPDWCIIEQEEGEAQPDSLVHYGKGENTNVKVQYYDNPDLDDRTDIITIASDGFVGKKLEVFQLGIAYLNVPEADIKGGLMIEKAGGDLVVNVKTNQKWTAKIVPQGSDKAEWLAISSGASGELDGTVTITVEENSGEKRYSNVAIYDRYGEERAMIKITQDGVQLDPATFEIHAGYDQLSYTLNVVCNSAWEAEGDSGWFTIENPTGHSGNGTLNITITQNDTPDLRTGTISLKTIAANPGDPVLQKDVVFKQAYKVNPVRINMDNDEIANWKSDKGFDPVYEAGVGTTFATGATGYSRLNRSMKAGSYSFHWNTFSADAKVRHWFCYSGGQEIKFNLYGTGSTEISLSASDGEKPSISSSVKDLDMTKDHIVTYNFNQVGSYCQVSMLIDGVEAGSFVSSETVLYNCKWGADINMYIGVEIGSAVLDWYEYTAPFSWDEE